MDTPYPCLLPDFDADVKKLVEMMSAAAADASLWRDAFS